MNEDETNGLVDNCWKNYTWMRVLVRIYKRKRKLTRKSLWWENRVGVVDWTHV